MKILLAYRANEEYCDAQQQVIPNGLYYIAALLLDNGFDVKLKNYSYWSNAKIRDDLREVNPDILGLTCYTFNAVSNFEVCSMAKEISRSVLTVLGGPHPGNVIDAIFEEIPSVDVITLGEGEMTFLDLVNAVKEKRDLESVMGIILRKGDSTLKTLPRKPNLDLDSLTIPAKYFQYLRLITTRGCPGDCIFCSTPAIWGRRIRKRSPEHILEELKLLKEQYGQTFFVFSDDTFTAHRRRTIRICQLIVEEKLDITWDCRSRVNFIDEEQLQWMRKAGCISIAYGLESGSPEVLKNLSKMITLEQIQKAADITRKAGMQLTFFLIVGSPGESDKTIEETIEVLRMTRPHDILVSIMSLTPDTHLCRKVGVPPKAWFTKMAKPYFYTEEHTLEEMEGYRDRIHAEFAQMHTAYTFEELVQLIRDEPDSAALPWNNVGLIYLSKGMVRDALGAFLRSVKLNHGYPHAWNNLGIASLQAGNRERALACFRKAARQHPEDIDIRMNLGRLHASLGNAEEARNSFEEILAIDYQHATAKAELRALNGGHASDALSLTAG
ncbi:TPA: radical SAM protein [Candidatus Woesearchaeota archaeon]|nr:radical SAM protein [Candidatus Woesearchaeota archaeon]HII69329.1 radical SAM protein [Candidatus Woesearchaeota archaeon]